MAKKVAGQLKLQVKAGSANPSPPIGPALGQRGINIMEFCKAFNAATQEMEKGMPIPVVITYYQDKSFTFIMKQPPVSYFLKKEAKITSGSKLPGKTKYEPITLTAGVTHDPTFEAWANLVNNFQGDAAMSLKRFRKDITIEVRNEAGQPVLAYNVFRCWVSEYQALPELDASANGVMIQTIKLENEGWERDLAVTEPTEA